MSPLSMIDVLWCIMSKAYALCIAQQANDGIVRELASAVPAAEGKGSELNAPAMFRADLRQVRDEAWLLNGSDGEGQVGDVEQSEMDRDVSEEREVDSGASVQELKLSVLE